MDRGDAAYWRLGVDSSLTAALAAFFRCAPAIIFATVMLPARHPVPVSHFHLRQDVAVNLGRTTFGTVAACTVFAMPAVADYRSLDTDPVTSPWLWPRQEASVARFPEIRT